MKMKMKTRIILGVISSIVLLGTIVVILLLLTT